MPSQIILIALILGVIFVNGWTDAPSAIVSAVVTRAIPSKKAVVLSAIANLLGTVLMLIINSSVMLTIENLIDFNSLSKHNTTCILSASLITIIVWASVASIFGIPTSESHALVASIVGAGFSASGVSSVNFRAITSVLIGLVTSVVIGLSLSYIITKVTELIIANLSKIKYAKKLMRLEVLSSFFMSFMHGAQDGLKFVALLILVLKTNHKTEGGTRLVLGLMVGVVLGLGTMVGGYRIIKKIGLKMVKIEVYQGFSADLGGAISLLLPSLLGIPVSTTHAKTAAMVGAGATKSLKKINFKVIGSLMLSWVLTIPISFIMAFLLYRVFNFFN